MPDPRRRLRSRRGTARRDRAGVGPDRRGRHCVRGTGAAAGCRATGSRSSTSTPGSPTTSAVTRRGSACSPSTRTTRDQSLRVVTITDATSAGGRSRAQAAAQLSRPAHAATENRIDAFAIALESADAAARVSAAELAAHLLCTPDAAALSGAELVADAAWVGLRSHPAGRGHRHLWRPRHPRLARRRAPPSRHRLNPRLPRFSRQKPWPYGGFCREKRCQRTWAAPEYVPRTMSDSDILELNRLAYRYAAAVDGRDVDAFLAVFAPDGAHAQLPPRRRGALRRHTGPRTARVGPEDDGEDVRAHRPPDDEPSRRGGRRHRERERCCAPPGT